MAAGRKQAFQVNFTTDPSDVCILSLFPACRDLAFVARLATATRRRKKPVMMNLKQLADLDQETQEIQETFKLLKSSKRLQDFEKAYMDLLHRIKELLERQMKPFQEQCLIKF